MRSSSSLFMILICNQVVRKENGKQSRLKDTLHVKENVVGHYGGMLYHVYGIHQTLITGTIWLSLVKLKMTNYKCLERNNCTFVYHHHSDFFLQWNSVKIYTAFGATLLFNGSFRNSWQWNDNKLKNITNFLLHTMHYVQLNLLL